MISAYPDQNVRTGIHNTPKVSYVLKENIGKKVILCYSSAHIEEITSKSSGRRELVRELTESLVCF